jgi:ATPase complex subunit ATP10
MRMLLDRNPENISTISRIPIPAGTPGEKFVPQPLARPLGLPYPPQPGQNSPVDRRTLAEKKAEFGSYDKALERRRVLFRQFLRPYFQEWKRLDREFKGKTFVSNERLFRKDKALWFPNMWGSTLRKDGDGADGGRDLVEVLRGRVSVVAIQSGNWAEEQVQSFLGEKDGENPKLRELMDGSGGLVQRVDVNVQADWVRQVLVRLFKGRLRSRLPESRWERYFMVKLARDVGKGLSEDVRDAMGLLNSQVGYVYLVDTECRIRWAGSGNAWKGEADWLNTGIRRLLDEAREANRVEGRSKSRVSVPSESRPQEIDRAREAQTAVA